MPAGLPSVGLCLSGGSGGLSPPRQSARGAQRSTPCGAQSMTYVPWPRSEAVAGRLVGRAPAKGGDRYPTGTSLIFSRRRAPLPPHRMAMPHNAPLRRME
eukprot:4649212-Prymnesium_polylepis.1